MARQRARLRPAALEAKDGLALVNGTAFRAGIGALAVHDALALNDLERRGDIGPIAITRDHLDTGSVASPYRETEGMKDGSDAVAD